LISYTFIIITFLVLKAINEDSPTVPTLLTDYILKGKYYYVLKLFTKFIVMLVKYLHQKIKINIIILISHLYLEQEILINVYYNIGQYFFHLILVDFILFYMNIN